MPENSTYLTILTKNSLFSFLGLVRAELIEEQAEEENGLPDPEFDLSGLGTETKRIIAIIKHDPREGQPFLKQFDTNSEAVRNYQNAISTSLERGWNVVYRGQPMYG